jgi:hypothetical protein
MMTGRCGVTGVEQMRVSSRSKRITPREEGLGRERGEWRMLEERAGGMGVGCGSDGLKLELR